MPITLDDVSTQSQFATIRGNLERQQKALTNDQFLDALSLAFILKEVDIERLLKELAEK